MRERIPLDLFIEVSTADGTKFKWDANQAPGSRLQNARFASKIGEGFSDGGGQLPRRIDQDYPDLGLVNTVTFIGADGSVAYEGRLSEIPRELSDRHSIGVTLTGWMAHAKDRKFQEIYADRDPSRWGQPSLSRQAALLTAGRMLGDVSWQSADGGQTLNFPTNAVGNPRAIAELWYTAPPGCKVSQIQYLGATTGSGLAGWVSDWYSMDDTGATTNLGSVSFGGTLLTRAVTTPQRQVFLQVDSNSNSVTPTAGTARQVTKIGAYGNSGITLRTGDTTEPSGVFGSDVIKDIVRRFCTKLNTSGVQATSYVIQHLAFADRTYPYDAFLEINKFHQWHLGVWENKTLVYRPYDLTDYQWEIRTDDPGTTFSPTGPSTENLFNGICVTYTDILTGVVNVLDPENNAELRDESSGNPWNQHGIPRWAEITLSTPTLEDQALSLGQGTLADLNRPRTPGTITVRGYIRDRAGNEQPYWKVRAGDTIVVTNFPNDTPRLIVEASQDVENRMVTMAIDRPFALVEAYIDRAENALGARGLA